MKRARIKLRFFVIAAILVVFTAAVMVFLVVSAKPSYLHNRGSSCASAHTLQLKSVQDRIESNVTSDTSLEKTKEKFSIHSSTYESCSS